MIWLAVVAAALGFAIGWVARWWDTARAAGLWIVTCGNCADRRHAGPRRQLSIELWDSYGNQYKQWRVGRWGEDRETREPGPWLYDAIAAEVRRVGMLTRHGSAFGLAYQEHTEPETTIDPKLRIEP